jgi:2-dehydro-3-deoxy-D-arabinonate dehydratase
MRYYQFTKDGTAHVGVETSAGTLADLTAASPETTSVLDMLKASATWGRTVDQMAQWLVQNRPGPTVTVDSLVSASIAEAKSAGSGRMKMLPPVIAPEVWAAGVTYQDSMRERQAESGTPDLYAKIYVADRPEVFFKATAARLVGPFGQVGIRADSTWDVPEPELAFVLFGGKIVGYTCGNDMSSRSIEGENALYLPQAKLYDRSCSIGPCFVSAGSVPNPQALRVQLTIERGGKQVFKGESNTSKMKRTCAEIADWLQRHNPVPDGTTVLTGTSIVPPSSFTLKAGDVTRVEIEGIGTLVNTVVVV